MAKGLLARGVEVSLANSAREASTKIVACWGWRLGKLLRQDKREVIVMERGYLGDRMKWTSLCWNGLNGRGAFPVHGDPARFERHFTMQPWKTGGAYVLILGQVPRDQSLQGRDLMPWYARAAREAHAAYGMPVLFRRHPLDRTTVPPSYVDLCTGSLAEALEGAAVAITFNSNSAVDAVLAGVPSVVGDEGSMALEVSSEVIGVQHMPDRRRWAHALAWKQWTLDEIQSGAALVGLLEMAESPA